MTIIGNTDLVSGAAQIASQMYATNMLHLILHMCGNPKKPDEGKFQVDFDDIIVRAVTVAKIGQGLTWPPPKGTGPPPPRMDAKKTAGAAGDLSVKKEKTMLFGGIVSLSEILVLLLVTVSLSSSVCSVRRASSPIFCCSSWQHGLAFC